MTRPAHLKQRILRGAVEENVSTIEGRLLPRPASVAEGPSRRRPAPAQLMLLLAMTLVLAVSAAALLLRRAPAAQADAVGDVARSAPAVAEAAEDPALQLTFPEPRPIDASVFPVEVRRITIDPGHGGDDYGTSENGLVEKDLTLDIAQRLRKLLVKQSYEVNLTRESDVTRSLRERAEIANQSASDLFISIHINWLYTRQVRGIETYYLGPTEDPELAELARRENRRSGYTLAEMRPLLEQIYTDYLQQQSYRFAGRVQRALFSSLVRVTPTLKNRGVKTAPFVVLVSTEMPAILAEVSCLSNAEEAELLARPLYREHIAEALARGIGGYAEDVQQIEEKGS